MAQGLFSACSKEPVFALAAALGHDDVAVLAFFAFVRFYIGVLWAHVGLAPFEQLWAAAEEPQIVVAAVAAVVGAAGDPTGFRGLGLWIWLDQAVGVDVLLEVGGQFRFHLC